MISSRLIRKAPIALCLLLLVSSPGYAQITIEELQSVDFGMIPGVANTTCIMHQNGTMLGDCVGTGTPGLLRINGTPNARVRVTGSGSGWVNNAQFSPYLNGNDTKNARQNLDGSGLLMINVGGELALKNGFQPGFQTFLYTVTITYN